MARATRIGITVLAVAALPAAVADAQMYIYNRGWNFVDTGGNRCVVGSASAQPEVQHTDKKAIVGSSVSGNRTVFCPINRRSLHYYGTATGAGMTTVNTVRITVRTNDNSTTGSLSCMPFSKTIGGGVSFGQTRYACPTFLGCTSDPGGSFTGDQSLNFSNFSASNTVQWGVSCSLPPGSGVYYIEAQVTPN